MGKYDKYYDTVREISDYLKKDLFGVSSENEVLEDIEPLNTYVTGILYPKKISQVFDRHKKSIAFDKLNKKEQELTISDNIEIENFIENSIEDGYDIISKANNYKPSSMGISVMIPENVKKLNIIFKCGIYKHFEGKKQIVTEQETKEITTHKYIRIPKKVDLVFDIPIKPGVLTKKIFPDEFDAEINLTLRKIMPNGSKLITVSAMNNTIEKNELRIRNECSLFQCEISVKSDISFLPVYQNLYYDSDIEVQIRDLLYRTVKNYGYGHGCAVSYNEADDGVFEIHSDFIPMAQVNQMTPGKIKNDKVLLLNNWKIDNKSELINCLNAFINEYCEWKELKKTEINIKNHFYKAMSEIINRIEICIARLKKGIDVLENNNFAWRAFILMNEAMLLQRMNTKNQKVDSVKWYPFQLAYILQIIPDIVNPESEYRDIVDLLWFPTGGGKTEAYLGVAAFSIFYRRISQNIAVDGVTVIMRYTLRLLTIQQFERAAAMICACEYLRRKNNISGGEISIGLWIGSGMTPNNIDAAKTVLNKLKNNKDEKIYEGNPVQITKCPWCGEIIDITGYKVGNNGLTIRCSNNPDCEFHNKLPIYDVDEDIYNHRPTFLLSTIDKFARIVWVENSKNLFGVGSMPPSLIIQDELHLISGSLGSLAGLYEIAVDYLCQKDDISPKIIASTATVKNADEQIINLYGKKMSQFPPNGISFDDSFFAHIADKNERPARTYIGVCENGGSLTDLIIRVYAILMYIKALFIKQNKSPDIIDQYYTIIGYFNAIRDLGASSNIIQDRIYTYIITLINRKFKDISNLFELTSKDIPVFLNDELTSRKSSKEIKETLEQLEVHYNESGSFAYVLASNMLSVGIDINRLGLMTVYNQPKTNSEYIQATSRVGRLNPGLVIAMYNPIRSRDKSHYEQFSFYHKSFYQYVEATSVTPFSVRAMEKALHCVFIAMIRLTVSRLGKNNSAVNFNKDDLEVQKVKEFILNRVLRISPESFSDAQNILDEIILAWHRLTEIHSILSYESRNGEPCLLNSAENISNLDFPPVLNSLRNVEEAVGVYV